MQYRTKYFSAPWLSTFTQNAELRNPKIRINVNGEATTYLPFLLPSLPLPLVTLRSPHHAPNRHTHCFLPFSHQPITPDPPPAQHNLLHDLKSQFQIDISRPGRRGFQPYRQVCIRCESLVVSYNGGGMASSTTIFARADEEDVEVFLVFGEGKGSGGGGERFEFDEHSLAPLEGIGWDILGLSGVERD